MERTNNLEESELVDISKDGDLIDNEGGVTEIESITDLLKGVTEPIAKGQEIAEKEATKRAAIFAGVASKIIYGVILIAVLIVVLAAIALIKGNTEMAEKLVIALLAFMGGLGAGKAAGK